MFKRNLLGLFYPSVNAQRLRPRYNTYIQDAYKNTKHKQSSILYKENKSRHRSQRELFLKNKIMKKKIMLQ